METLQQHVHRIAPTWMEIFEKEKEKDFANDMGSHKVSDNTPHPPGFPLAEFPQI